MTVFIAILLTMLTSAFIIYPLFKQRSPLAGSLEDEKLRELHSRRDTSYSMLKELEFDFQAGTLTEENYQDLKARYKKKAISILRNIDDLENGTEVEDEIERQIQEPRQHQGRFCSQCGAKCQEDDRFCPHCRAKLNQGGRVD